LRSLEYYNKVNGQLYALVDKNEKNVGPGTPAESHRIAAPEDPNSCRISTRVASQKKNEKGADGRASRARVADDLKVAAQLSYPIFSISDYKISNIVIEIN
jgi:hypothetical protein